MNGFFKPYEGDKPYFFVSYSHRDSETVIETIRPIHDRYYRLWYDEGIPAGSDWPRNIAVHMRDCGMVLFFLSRTALASPNCLSEISTAARQGKPILLVKLEEINGEEIPPRWKECLKDAVVPDAGASAEERTAAILNSGLLSEKYLGTEEDFQAGNSGRGREGLAAKIAIALSALLLAAALGTVACLGTGVITIPSTPAPTAAPTPEPSVEPTPELTPEPTPEPATPTPSPAPTWTPEPTQTPVITASPTVATAMTEGEKNQKLEFDDKHRQEERTVRRILGTPEDGEAYLKGDLEKIEAVYFVGTQYPPALKGLEIDRDGTVSLNGVEVSEGSISDLELISLMRALKHLAIVKQPLASVAGLNAMTQLEDLNLAATKITSLNGLRDLPCLRKLNLEHTCVRDLTPLAGLPRLETVTVSLDMLPLTMDAGAAYEVIVVK